MISITMTSITFHFLFFSWNSGSLLSIFYTLDYRAVSPMYLLGKSQVVSVADRPTPNIWRSRSRVNLMQSASPKSRALPLSFPTLDTDHIAKSLLWGPSCLQEMSQAQVPHVHVSSTHTYLESFLGHTLSCRWTLTSTEGEQANSTCLLSPPHSINHWMLVWKTCL